MNGGQMPAVVAEHIAAKHHLPMHAVLNSTITQDPYAAYWKVEVEGPHGSLICIPVSDQMMLAGGLSAATKHGPKQMSESHMTERQMKQMNAYIDADMHKMIEEANKEATKHAEYAALYGAGPVELDALLADYKEQIKAQLNAEIPLFKKLTATAGMSYAEFKMHKAYDPPTKPAKVGQQISLDI